MPFPYKNRDSVGKCIYCNSDEEGLTNEHVLPNSLGGDFVLRSASCNACQIVIGRIENEFSRKFLLPFRTKRRYKTYNKKKRPETFSLKFGNSKEEAIDTEVSASMYPALGCLPVLRRAALLTGNPQANVSGVISLFCWVDITGIDQIGGKAEEKFISVENTLSIDMFMRLLAKIAHCALVSAAGLDGYTSFLPEIILGKSKQFFHYIGSPGNDTVNSNAQSTRISVKFRPVLNADDYFIVVTIKNLLRVKSCPTYEVIAARCDATAFDGAPSQFCDREVVRQRMLDYSKPTPGYFYFSYSLGTTLIVIRQIDGKNVVREGNSIVEARFRWSVLPHR